MWRTKRRWKREELARRVKALFEETTPEQRGPVVIGMVLGGLATGLLHLLTVPVLAVLLVRLRRRARIGRIQRVVLAGFAGVHGLRWVLGRILVRRLDRTLAEFGGKPGTPGTGSGPTDPGSCP